MFGGERMNDLGQLRVTDKTIKLDGGHRLLRSQTKREVWRPWPLGVNHKALGLRRCLTQVRAQARYQPPQRRPMMQAQSVATTASAGQMPAYHSYPWSSQ